MRPFNRHVGMTMFIAVAVFGGLANMVFALSSLFWLSSAALFVAGGAGHGEQRVTSARR
ncbi:hypothetical protein M4D79_13695 [Mycolicibacterium novocastrense]|nr:hypothetical protein M4D79_13695 [Mycolicibacterium novocastrense]